MRCKHVLDTCNCNTCEQRHDTRGCRRDGISGNTFTILPSRQGNLPCNFLRVLRQLCQLPGKCPAACLGHLQLQHLREDTRPVRARDRISGTHSDCCQHAKVICPSIFSGLCDNSASWANAWMVWVCSEFCTSIWAAWDAANRPHGQTSSLPLCLASQRK